MKKFLIAGVAAIIFSTSVTGEIMPKSKKSVNKNADYCAAFFSREDQKRIEKDIKLIPEDKLSETLFSALHVDNRDIFTACVVQKLVEAGANANETMQQSNGNSVNALGFVLVQGMIFGGISTSVDVIDVLVRNGADINAHCLDGPAGPYSNISFVKEMLRSAQAEKDEISLEAVPYFKEILYIMEHKKRPAPESLLKPTEAESTVKSVTNPEAVKAEEALAILNSLKHSVERYYHTSGEYPVSLDKLDIHVDGKKESDGSVTREGFNYSLSSNGVVTAKRVKKGKILYKLIHGDTIVCEDMEGNYCKTIKNLWS